MNIHEKIKEKITDIVQDVDIKISGTQKSCIVYLSGTLPGVSQEYANRRKSNIIREISEASKKLGVSVGVIWQIDDKSIQPKSPSIETPSETYINSVCKLKVETFIRKKSPCRVEDISIPEFSKSNVERSVSELIKNQTVGTTKSGLLFVRLSALANGLTKRQGLDRFLDKNGRKEV